MYKVLVVEDEPKMREGLKLIVPWAEHGFSLCGDAENGREALELIEREHPQLVITDIRMPVLNGLELMTELSGRIECQFIVVSGYDEFEYAKTALKCGAVDYLLKPIDEDQLVEALQKTRRRLDRDMPYMPESDSTAQAAPGGFVDDVIRYIRAHFREHLTIKEIAGSLFLHPIYLGQLFKKTTGVYFNEFVHRTRIEEAKKLLRCTNQKIFEIAVSVGYTDTDYFVQQFKKFVACTPSHYREKTD